MKSIDETKLLDRKKLTSAAAIRTEHYIFQLCQLVGYRQSIAQQMLSTHDKEGDYYSNLESLYNHTNEQIRRLIAI